MDMDNDVGIDLGRGDGGAGGGGEGENKWVQLQLHHQLKKEIKISNFKVVDLRQQLQSSLNCTHKRVTIN